MGITFAGRETRTIGIGALIVAIGAGMTSNLLFLAALQFRVDWFLEPTRLVGGGTTSAEFLRWASALDLIGYYLATGVLAYVLWRQLRVRSPLIRLLVCRHVFVRVDQEGARNDATPVICAPARRRPAPPPNSQHLAPGVRM